MAININQRWNQEMNRSRSSDNDIAAMSVLDNLIGSMLLQQPNVLPDMQNPITNQTFMDAQAYQMDNQPSIPTPIRQNGGVSGSWDAPQDMSYIDNIPIPVIQNNTQDLGVMPIQGQPQVPYTPSTEQIAILNQADNQLAQQSQPQAVQQPKQAKQQTSPPQDNTQQGGLTLDALLGSLLGGLTQPITQPLVSDTGDTSTLYDMMRFVANTQSPEAGKIIEGNLKTKQADAKANKELIAAELKRQQELKDDMDMAVFKASLEEQKNAGKIDDKDASIIQKQINDFKKDDIYSKAISSISAIGNVKTAIASESKITPNFIKRQLAIAAGEKGRLTEQDVQAFAGSTDAMSRLVRAYKKFTSGKLSSMDKKEVMILIDAIEQRAKRDIEETGRKYKKSLKNLRPNLDESVIDSSFSPFIGSNDKVVITSIKEVK